MGKALVGIQVPARNSNAFSSYLARLGYQYVEETDNNVYKSFLC